MLAIVRKGQAFCRILRFFDSKMYRPEKRRTCTKKTSVLVQLRERTKKPAEIVSAGFHLEVPSRFELENKGFADLRLTTWLWHQQNGAVDEARTRDLHLGKVALYQLSYYRRKCALGRNRTTDTVIFSHMLYRLSYQGLWRPGRGSNPRPPA